MRKVQAPSSSQHRQCKRVISKLQRVIDREGHQIIPQLIELWKRRENSSVLGGSEDNFLDLKTIGLRVDQSKYGEVLELVSDVQLMLKCGMQHYGFSYEVRSEARKVHDLFFDIMKIAFPDTDFGEAKNSLSFSSPVAMSVTGSSSRQNTRAGQGKRQKSVKEVDSDKTRVPQKKSSRLGSSSSRELTQPDDARPSTHPGDLVICKKKRKDREKSAAKSGNRPAGPLSPSGQGRSTNSPGSVSGGKDTGSSQQPISQQGRTAVSPQQGNSGGGSDELANPVKRMRTDAGRRRPRAVNNVRV